MTDKRKTYLKKEIKKKLGNELSAFLGELSNYEMNMLLSGDIKANTLKKYSWFFKATTHVGGKKRKWLKKQYEQYKNREPEYIYKIFKCRKPDDHALESVLKEKDSFQSGKTMLKRRH